MLALAAWLSIAAASAPDPDASYPPTHQVSFGLPLAIGGTVAAPPIASEFALGFRPSVTWSPARLRNFGVGAYGEISTVRTFKDLHLGGGLELGAPGELWLHPILSVGALASLESRGWVSGLEAGLFYGIHDSYTGPTGILGAQLTARYYFSAPESWTVTLAFEVDVIWFGALFRQVFVKGW